MHFFNLICLMDRREQCMSDYMSEWGCHVGASYELTVDEGLLLQITNIYIEYKLHIFRFKKKYLSTVLIGTISVINVFIGRSDTTTYMFCISFCLGYV